VQVERCVVAVGMFLLAMNVGVGVASAAPPVVETTGTPVRTTTTAQLAGRVDPQGAVTTYFFEYGDQGPCGPNPCAGTPAKPAGAGGGALLVAEEVGGLASGNTYHYRLVADNGDPGGPSFGADMTVTTRSSEAPLFHGHFPGPPGSDRAWEQISPPDTGGNPVNDAIGFSANGGRALFSIAGGTPLSDTGNLFSPFLAERTGEGWQQKPILPPRDTSAGSPNWHLIPDASLSTVSGAVLKEGTEEAEIWRLDAGGSQAKLFVGQESVLSLPDHGISDDGSRLLALIAGSQDPQHPASNLNLYDLTSGAPQLISLLPDGSVPACGAQTTGFSTGTHPVSADGSLAFFESRGHNCLAPEKVYVRDIGANETELISPSPVSGLECDSAFLSASEDAVFLWSKSRLAAEDSPTNSCGNDGLDGDIYRGDLHGAGLKCVTCVSGALDADVYVPLDNGTWRVLEYILVAEDGSRVYFQSPRGLVPGAPEVSGGGSVYRVNVNTGDLAWVGGPNLGLQPNENELTPDGATLFFRSSSAFLNPLGGSDNGGTDQYYRYDDRDRSLLCVSCPRDGAVPRESVIQGRLPISDSGEHLAFATATPLLSVDQNTPAPGDNPERGRDVYEWRDGRHLLVTDGLADTTPETEGPVASGMSGDGRDLYFIAPGQYTPDALDGYRRLYDARIGGGFQHPTAPPPCPLEVCQGTPKGAPEEAAPGSASFSGRGNVKPRHVKHPQRRRKAKKHRHKHKHKTKRHHHRAKGIER
jgi:hypothetical protein